MRHLIKLNSLWRVTRQQSGGSAAEPSRWHSDLLITVPKSLWARQHTAAASALKLATLLTQKQFYWVNKTTEGWYKFSVHTFRLMLVGYHQLMLHY